RRDDAGRELHRAAARLTHPALDRTWGTRHASRPLGYQELHLPAPPVDASGGVRPGGEDMDTTTAAGPNRVKGMGWLPDRPDVRDYVSTTPAVQEKLSTAGSKTVRLLAERAAAVEQGSADPAGELPASADLREWFSPVEDQG